ncbi:hypothetical protein LINPERHAP2_LOCUS18839, partial [Linum perenne]
SDSRSCSFGRKILKFADIVAFPAGSPLLSGERLTGSWQSWRFVLGGFRRGTSMAKVYDWVLPGRH